MIDKVDPFRNRRVTYWAERNGPPVVQIIDRLQNPVEKLLFLLVNYLDNAWPVSFGPLSEPSAFEVIYLVQYLGGFIYFSFHATKKRSKNTATLGSTCHGYGVCGYGYGVGKPDLWVTHSKPYLELFSDRESYEW
jgi:hypothetical protein